MITKILKAVAREVRVNLNHFVFRLREGLGLRKRAAIRPDTVAIVRLDRIGDFVLATPALAWFRQAFPGSHLTLVGNAEWRDLAVWLNTHGVVEGSARLFDEFAALRPQDLTAWREYCRAARLLESFDTVVHFCCSRTNLTDKLIATAPGRKIACVGDHANSVPWQAGCNEVFYDVLFPSPAATLEHERNIEFIANLVSAAADSRHAPRWHVPPDVAAEGLDSFAKREGIRLVPPFIAMSPLTSARLRDWSMANYVELAHRVLARRPDVSVIVLGAQADAARLNAAFGNQPVTCLAGRASLVASVLILSKAAVSVSGETAPAHIASAVGTPAVVVMGGGHYGRFLPYPAPHETGANVALTCQLPCFGCNWFCRYRLLGKRAAPCVAGVSVGDVLERVLEFLP